MKHTTTAITTETFQAQYPLALIALGEHIAAHQLPAPLDIFVLDEYREGRLTKVIRLHLPGQHTHAAWVSSVHVDAEHQEPADAGNGVRTQWDVRLPETGFRFQLVGFTHRQLSAVSA